MRKGIVFLVLCMGLMALSLTACIWGVVKDSQTGGTIPGAKITFVDSLGQSGTVYTDSNGFYTCDVTKGCPIPAKGAVDFTVSATGYNTLNETRDIQYDDPPERFWETQNFQLQQKSLGKIAFTEGDGNFWIIKSDGSGKTFIAGNVDPYGPQVWSPSGSLLALQMIDLPTAEKPWEGRYWAIFDLTGKIKARIDPELKGSWDFQGGLSWFPDETSVIYGVYIEGIYEFDLTKKQKDFTDWVEQNQHKREILWTVGYTFNHSPSWSPDGTMLAFVHHEWSSDFYVSLIKFDEGKVPYRGEDRFNGVYSEDFSVIASGRSEQKDQNFRFQWTPDSKKFVFASGSEKYPRAGTIYVADTTTGTVNKIQPEDYAYLFPENVDLSNDGQQIAFSTRGELDVVNTDGSNMRKVFDGEQLSLDLNYPRWSPDDSQIAFVDSAGTGIYIINADGSGLRSIPNTEETHAIEWARAP